MSVQLFFQYLLWVTLATAAFLAAGHYGLVPMQQHWGLSVTLIIVFVALSVALFYAGRSSVKSANKFAFNGLVSGSVFGKMVLAVTILYIYQQTTLPTNQWFVGIFLFVYIVYTVFEVWFMSKIART